MTPRQLDRAVNAALGRILPPMVQALRDDLVTALREELAARDGAPACAEIAKKAEPFGPAAPGTEWVVGIGAGRRLTEAGLAHLQALQAAGKHPADIAAEMGITRRAVDLRSGPAASNQASTHSRRAKPTELTARAKELFAGGKGTAEIARVLGVPKTTVQGWKDRGGWARGVAEVPPAPAEDGAKPRTVEPAAEVPAPRQPLAPILPQPRVRSWFDPAPHVPLVKPKPQLVTTTPKEVRAWLIASMKAGGLSLVQAQDRVGFMTHDQALAEANQRRIRAGYPPYAFLGAQRVAGGAA